MAKETNITSLDRTFMQQLEDTLSKAIEEGNREVIQNAPHNIKNHFHRMRENALLEVVLLESGLPLVQGCATTAWYYAYQDSRYMVSAEYGGLGLIASSELRRESFCKNQLWFATVKGNALEQARLEGNALWYAETSGAALKSAQCKDNALWYSMNTDDALRNSKNEGFSLRGSVNKENTLFRSTNYSSALCESWNTDDALNESSNSGGTLERSHNFKRALRNSYNTKNALQGSINTDHSLWYAKIRDHALTGSTNGSETLNTDEEQFKESRFFWKDKVLEEELLRERTCEEVGKILGVTRSRVDQIERKAIKKIRRRFPKALSTSRAYVTDAEMNKILRDHIQQQNKCSPYYTVLPSLDAVQKQIKWVTHHPSYSTNIRSSEAIGAWAVQSRLYQYLQSGYTSRIMWGVREDLFQSDSD